MSRNDPGRGGRSRNRRRRSTTLLLGLGLLGAPTLLTTATTLQAASAGEQAPAAAGRPAAPAAVRPWRAALNELQESGQRFQPVWSAGGAVASQEEQASAAGAALLRAGGNAVDAAVATAFALAVTLPQAGNLGGGGFAVLWLPGVSPAAGRGCLPPRSSAAAAKPPATAAGRSAAASPGSSSVPAGRGTPESGDSGPELILGGGHAVAVNFRETAPAAAGPALFRLPDGGVDRGAATRSLKATAVPGSVAGLVLLQHCYGRLPLRRVMAPAIALAERGVRVDRELADSLAAAQPLLQADPGSRALFLRSGSSGALRPPQPGELLRQPRLAATLRRIALQGWAGFYRGPVAEALVELMRERGGLIRHSDLQAYRARLVRPLLVHFRGHPVLSMPPPGGGLTLAQLLRLLEPMDLEASGAGSAAAMHRLAEAMNLAFRDRNTWLGDPDQNSIPAEALLSEAHLAALRARIDPQRHTPARELLTPGSRPLQEGVNTTHLSVADSQGGLVALTTTLNFAYGNGVSVAEAGFLLNNEMDDFSLAPGSANAFGLVQGPANAIAPGRRPLSSMAPTLVFRPDGSPWLATGSPGGSRIITTVLQVLLQRLLWGANLATAVAAPRLHSQLLPDELALEQGFSPDSQRLLEALGHRLRPAAAMGAANSVEVLSPPGSGSLAVMDPRRGRDGAVAERW